MDNCTQMQELISRLLDKDLSREERETLRRHLEDCPECRTMYEAFSAVSGALREDLSEPPESIRENVMSQLRREQMVRRSRRPWRTALTAAAAVLLMVAGLRVVSLSRSSDTVKLSAAALPMEAGSAVQETAPEAEEAAGEEPVEAEEAAETEMALFDAAAFEAVADSDEVAPAEEYEAPMFAAPSEAASNASASRAVLGAPAAAAAAQSSDADFAVPVIDLKSMSLAALCEALKAEALRPAPDLVAGTPVCTLLASDGALELYGREGELFCFSPEDGAPLRIPLTLEQIAALG